MSCFAAGGDQSCERLIGGGQSCECAESIGGGQSYERLIGAGRKEPSMGRNGFYDGENFLKSMDLLKAMTAVRDNTVLDKTDPASVQQGIEDYFSLCTDCGTRPLVSRCAAVRGLRRVGLLFVVSGQKKNGFSEEGVDGIKY